MQLVQRFFVLRVNFLTNLYRKVQTEFSHQFLNTPVSNKSIIFNELGNIADKPRRAAIQRSRKARGGVQPWPSKQTVPSQPIAQELSWELVNEVLDVI